MKNSLLLGAHISGAGGLEKAFERAEAINCTTMQIFTKSNRQWRAKELTDNDIKRFKERAKKTTVQITVVHASYLINIGSPKEELRTKSTNALIIELERCVALGIPYLVLHPGSAGDSTEEECLALIAQQLDVALSAVPGSTMILLENTAGQGTAVGHRFEHLSAIYQQVDKQDRIGFCLDTCHAFAAGYEFRTTPTYEAMIEKIDTLLGIENLKALHINDSKKELHSRVDRHEHIGKGHLGLEPFRLLFNDPRLFGIPKLLETPSSKADDLEYAENMQILKELLSDETKKILQ